LRFSVFAGSMRPSGAGAPEGRRCCQCAARTVKWFNDAKGFDSSSDLTVRMCSCTIPPFRLMASRPERGQAVEFDVVKAPRACRRQRDSRRLTGQTPHQPERKGPRNSLGLLSWMDAVSGFLEIFLPHPEQNAASAAISRRIAGTSLATPFPPDRGLRIVRLALLRRFPEPLIAFRASFRARQSTRPKIRTAIIKMIMSSGIPSPNMCLLSWPAAGPLPRAVARLSARFAIPALVRAEHGYGALAPTPLTRAAAAVHVRTSQ